MNIDKYKKDDAYEMDGCHYETSEDVIMTGIFGFCGCTGSEPLQVIVNTLQHFKTSAETGKYWNDLVNEVFNGVEGAAYITAELLDSKGFIEHGIAIRCSWVTEKGEEVLSDCLELLSNLKES